MKGTQVRFNIITIVLAVLYAFILIITNVSHISIPVAFESGSYAAQFVSEKHLDSIELADSEKQYFDIRYENFSYNQNSDGTICLEGYEGLSTDVIVPYVIGEKVVTSIGEKFFDNLHIKSVTIPDTVLDIDADVNESITIFASKDSVIYQNNQPEEDEEELLWNVELLNDSEFVNHFNGDIPFEYNDNGDSIELVRYTGKDDLIIIPSHIDGKPVTTVSFDLVGKYIGVVFPKTVILVNGKLGMNVYSSEFAIGIIFAVLAFVLVLIFVNIALPRIRKDLKEIHLSSPQIVLSFVYLIGQLVFSSLVIYKNIVNAALELVISVAWMALYLVLMLAAKTGRSYQKQVEEHITERTKDMKALKASVAGLSDGIDDPELKKTVMRVEEEIKYLPNGDGTISDIEKLENLLGELYEDIKGDKAKALSKCEEIMGMVKGKYRNV